MAKNRVGDDTIYHYPAFLTRTYHDFEYYIDDFRYRDMTMVHEKLGMSQHTINNLDTYSYYRFIFMKTLQSIGEENAKALAGIGVPKEYMTAYNINVFTVLYIVIPFILFWNMIRNCRQLYEQTYGNQVEDT